MALPRRTLKLNLNVGLTEEKYVNKSYDFTDHRTYNFTEAINRAGIPAKMMGQRARGYNVDLGAFDKGDQEIGMNTMMDAIENMPEGDRTAMLHQAMKGIAGVERRGLVRLCGFTGNDESTRSTHWRTSL